MHTYMYIYMRAFNCVYMKSEEIFCYGPFFPRLTLLMFSQILKNTYIWTDECVSLQDKLIVCQQATQMLKNGPAHI